MLYSNEFYKKLFNFAEKQTGKYNFKLNINKCKYTMFKKENNATHFPKMKLGNYNIQTQK